MSLSIGAPHVLSLLFLFFLLFVESYSVFCCCFILFIYFRCLYSNERERKGMAMDGELWGSGRDWWRGNYNQNIVYEKNLFPIKEKRKQNQ